MPFLWRAMEWAKSGGILAFALEARLILLLQGPTALRLRNAAVSGRSGNRNSERLDLEKTAVWRLPWTNRGFLLWARNELPDLDEHTFHLLTPVRENELAQKGEFRLDYQSAYPVPDGEGH